VSSLAW